MHNAPRLIQSLSTLASLARVDYKGSKKDQATFDIDYDDRCTSSMQGHCNAVAESDITIISEKLKTPLSLVGP